MLPTPISNLASPTDDDATNKNRQQKGTGFTNIGDILNANQGAGAKIGQAVGSNLAGQASDVRAGIDASQNQFNTQANTADQNAQGAINTANGYVRGATEANNDYTSTLTDKGAAVDPTNYQQIGTNLYNAAYNGPTGLSNANQLQSQAANVAALGQLAGTSAGQSQLLNQVVQRGNYSQGDNALDSLLLGQGGQQYIKQGQTQANQVGQAANNAVSNATSTANAYGSAINNDKAQTIQNLNSSYNGTGTVDPTANPLGITGLSTDATTQATNYTNQALRVKQLIGGTDATGDTITAAGTKDANGNIIPGSQLTDADKTLLSNMGTMGVQGGSLFIDPNNPNAYTQVLNELSNQVNTNLGSQYYTGNQGTAANNLASILTGAQAGGQGDAAEIADFTTGPDKFNTQILPQNGGEQSLFGSLSTGIQGQISQNQSTATQLQNLYGVNNQGWGNVNDPIHGTPLNSQTASLGDLSAAYNNSMYSGLQNNYNTVTGQNLAQALSGQSDKSVADYLNGQAANYNNTANSLQSELASNSTSLQNAILKRIAAGSST